MHIKLPWGHPSMAGGLAEGSEIEKQKRKTMETIRVFASKDDAVSTT